MKDRVRGAGVGNKKLRRMWEANSLHRTARFITPFVISDEIEKSFRMLRSIRSASDMKMDNSSLGETLALDDNGWETAPLPIPPSSFPIPAAVEREEERNIEKPDQTS